MTAGSALVFAALPLLLVANGGCRGESAPHRVEPAEVARPIKEGDLGTIVLTEAAVRDLALETAPAASRKLPRSRSFGGEVVPPSGGAAVVTAPIAGTLTPPAKGAVPVVGQRVSRGQLLFGLVLTPNERVKLAEGRVAISASKVDATTDVERASAEAAGARDALERAEKLLQEGVGTAQTLEAARTRAALADAVLQGARTRRDALERLDVESTSAAPLRVEAPMSGVLFRVQAIPGQVVAEGATWIKVAVYAGELPNLAQGAEARVARLGRPEGTRETGIAARPVDAPSTATGRTASIDLFFEVTDAGAAGALRIGERVTATVPLREEAETLTVAWSAVVHDYHGGTWVYVETAPRTFVRKRVEVRYVVGDDAALEAGPPNGARVVVRGASELYGTELGHGK